MDQTFLNMLLQRMAGPQPAGMSGPGLLGGISSSPANFAEVLGGPLNGAMPQGQVEMPAPAPSMQPGAFSAIQDPSHVMLGDLFQMAKNNSGPMMTQRQNVLPVKNEAGVLGGSLPFKRTY